MAPILTAPATPIESKMDGAGTAIADRKTAPPAQDWLCYAVDSPFCRYAEAIRSVKIAADLSGALKSHKVIGVTSTLPNEGKSTIAANLAHLIADAGDVSFWWMPICAAHRCHENMLQILLDRSAP